MLRMPGARIVFVLFLTIWQATKPRIFGADRLPPVTVHPINPATVPDPMARDPNRVRMWTNHPMATRPDPPAMPRPNTRHPNISRSRRDRHHFRLHRRRYFTRRRRFRSAYSLRLRRGSWSFWPRGRSGYYGRRWRWRRRRLPHVYDSTFHAAGQQPNHNKTFEQRYRLFHR